MKFSTSREGDIAVITVAGRLSSAVAESFQTRLMAVLDENPKGVVVEVSELEFIASNGLRALILAAKRGHAGGYRVHLCGMRWQIREIFSVSGLLRIFPHHASLAEGLEAIKSPIR